MNLKKALLLCVAHQRQGIDEGRRPHRRGMARVEDGDVGGRCNEDRDGCVAIGRRQSLAPTGLVGIVAAADSSSPSLGKQGDSHDPRQARPPAEGLGKTPSRTPAWAAHPQLNVFARRRRSARRHCLASARSRRSSAR